MKKLPVVLVLLCLFSFFVAPMAVASADESQDPSEQEYEVVLTPAPAADGGFSVTVDVSGLALMLTFQVDRNGELVVLGLSGLPEDAQSEIEGDEVKITLVDGTEIGVGLGEVTLDEQGLPTGVKAEVETEGPEAPDEADADDEADEPDGPEAPDDTDEPDEADDTDEDSDDDGPDEDDVNNTEDD
ncbi:MAG: hypothetical protein ACR2FO_07390 [Actinomycetota bacterium]